MKLPEFNIQTVARPATVAELARLYKASSKFANLAHRTRVDYEDKLYVMLASPYKNKAPEDITPALADAIYQYVKANSGERSAQYFVAVWSAVYTYGVKFHGLLLNPWSLVSATTPAPRTQAWAEEQVFQVIEKALEIGEKGIAIGVCLMYDTAQRPGDILSLTYSNLGKDDSGWYLDFKQSKRGADVMPALSAYTVKLLELDDPLAMNNGMAWDSYLVGGHSSLYDFRKKFNEVKKLCNIPKELQLRDLRRTALTEMGAASDDQMVAVSGHSDRNMLGVYSIKTRTKALEAQKIRYATRNSRLNKIPGDN